MSLKRILMIGDVPPLPGFATTGAGFRSWGIGKGLEARGHQVFFSMPAFYLAKGTAPKGYAEIAWTPTNIPSVINKTNPDIVVFGSWPTVEIRERLNVPTVLDLQGPHLLERQMQGTLHQAANIREKLSAIEKADFFTCAGERQKLYFLGWLLAAGVALSENMIVSIPTPVSPELPAHEWSTGETTFVYGGYFLPWQDPSNGIEVLLDTMAARQRGRLKFFGSRPPHFSDDIGKAERFAVIEQQLQRSPRVDMLGVVPFDQLIEQYCRADVALDIMGRNVERELAFPTRTVHYLWCGLPVIHCHYAEMSGYIEDYGAGWVVDPDDTAAIRQAVEEALDCPDEVRRRGENARRLARERLAWDKTIEPLDVFCRDPWRRQPVAMTVVSYPRAVESKGGLATLAREAWHNYRHGGIRTVVNYSLQFLKRQIRPRSVD